MGLFDEVIIDRLFCPYCGSAIENGKWQTKDTECYLQRFDSLDEMFSKYYRIYYFDIIGKCDNCNEWPRLTIHNTSREHHDFLERESIRIKEEMQKRATENHPNHPDYDISRCLKCKKENEKNSR